MTCPVCSMDNPEGTSTCLRCGAPLGQAGSHPASQAGPPTAGSGSRFGEPAYPDRAYGEPDDLGTDPAGQAPEPFGQDPGGRQPGSVLEPTQQLDWRSSYRPGGQGDPAPDRYQDQPSYRSPGHQLGSRSEPGSDGPVQPGQPYAAGGHRGQQQSDQYGRAEPTQQLPGYPGPASSEYGTSQFGSEPYGSQPYGEQQYGEQQYAAGGYGQQPAAPRYPGSAFPDDPPAGEPPYGALPYREQYGSGQGDPRYGGQRGPQPHGPAYPDQAAGPEYGQQYAAGQYGTGQYGTGQYGTGQSGAGQYGAGEYGAGRHGAPPGSYPAQPYGQPGRDSPPVRRSGGRRARYAVLGAVVLVLVLAVLLSTRVFSSKVFDADQMNSDIASQYKDKFGERIEVSCPSGQKVTKGSSFTCEIKNRPEKIEVKVTSSDGDYTWRPQS